MSKQKDSAVPVVAVLLATSAPTEHIKEQIQSIKLQENVRTVIYWGDYGSSKITKENVRKLLKGTDYKEYDIRESGPAPNFFFLLKQSTEKYVAFADQDDVWLPNKLTKQVNRLQIFSGIPSLVHSNSELLMRNRRVSKSSLCKKHDFFSLAITNCCQGCTLMINDSARKKILSSLPPDIVWHDWWIGLVVSLTGCIFLADETEVLYRIHQGNTIGIPGTWKRIRNYLTRPSGLIAYQVEQAINRFDLESKLPKEDCALLRDMTSPNRMKRLKSNIKYLRQEGGNINELLHRIAWIVRRP